MDLNEEINDNQKRRFNVAVYDILQMLNEHKSTALDAIESLEGDSVEGEEQEQANGNGQMDRINENDPNCDLNQQVYAIKELQEKNERMAVRILWILDRNDFSFLQWERGRPLAARWYFQNMLNTYAQNTERINMRIRVVKNMNMVEENEQDGAENEENGKKEEEEEEVEKKKMKLDLEKEEVVTNEDEIEMGIDVDGDVEKEVEKKKEDE